MLICLAQVKNKSNDELLYIKKIQLISSIVNSPLSVCISDKEIMTGRALINFRPSIMRTKLRMNQKNVTHTFIYSTVYNKSDEITSIWNEIQHILLVCMMHALHQQEKSGSYMFRDLVIA